MSQVPLNLHLVGQTAALSIRYRSGWRITAIQFSAVHTLSEYYILIIARFVRGYAVFERVLARQALGAIL